MPPALVRPPSRSYRAFAYDSAHWDHYRPRADDIVIATYPKCGTTWTQRLVSMLVFQSAAPRPLSEVSPLNFFTFENSFWDQRRRDNVLLMHYADLKKDLAGEMRRLAAFLEISIPEALWPELVAAGSFGAMQRDGDSLMPEAARAWDGGARTFLHKGEMGRWRDLLTGDDVRLYEDKARRQLPEACVRWLERGRLSAGDPVLPD